MTTPANLEDSEIVDSEVVGAEIVDERNGLVARKVVVGALDTNCWVLFHPTDRLAVIVDPGDEAGHIIDACGGLTPVEIVVTHQHWDHVLAIPEIVDAYGLEVRAHPADRPVWPHELKHLDEHGHFDAGTATQQLLACGCSLNIPGNRPAWDGATAPLHHGEIIRAGQLALRTIHTPGHTPGSISLACDGHVFTGDTLFPGGPGLTGWPLSDFDTIIDSIARRLFALPHEAAVHPGHGASTSIGAETPSLQSWIERGW